ncbi:DUF2637 domain-containing protein [Microbispora cellulosiformans]|uniref:DUF2637 domain-containing protein n=2 Tax=Microbispora cellulosiformans TaxID=2614688 RepID=A0A5J5JWU0_9ACTN|nr:DUF2637 domain-containing protein [Microbispora cellulosiformans]
MCPRPGTTQIYGALTCGFLGPSRRRSPRRGGQGRRGAMSPCSRVDACIRWTTTASVNLLAVIAAVVSYRQIHELALRQGESELGAALVPLAVDGMIVAS